MQPFTVHTGTVAPLRRSNVDTDQIIPAEFLKRITRTGFEDGLFAAWRQDPDFVLNRPEHAGASILVAGPDFGTGSSREHAVWALLDGGFKVVVSPRFGDIFRNNAAKAGLLAVEVDAAVVDGLWSRVETDPTTRVTVDLKERTITAPGGPTAGFDIDEHTRGRLLEGLDDIAATLSHDADISTYEAARVSWKPRTLPLDAVADPA